MRRTRSPKRLLVAAVLAVWGMSSLAAPAGAATPPPNDTWRGAVALRLGHAVQMDTTGATTDRVDASANAGCGAPFTKASVWFTHKPSKAGRLVVDMSASSYSGGLMVFRGRPSQDTLISCTPQSLAFRARADHRYYIVAFSDTRRNGGDLVLQLDRVTPPRLRVTVDPAARVDREGRVIVTGNVHCANAEWLELGLQVEQAVGRMKVVGWGTRSSGRLCDGTWRDFAVVVSSDTGRFGGGKAMVDVNAYACNAFACLERSLVDHELSLRRAAD